MKSNLITDRGLLVNLFNYDDYSNERVVIKENFYYRQPYRGRFYYNRMLRDADLSFRIVLCNKHIKNNCVLDKYEK